VAEHEEIAGRVKVKVRGDAGALHVGVDEDGRRDGSEGHGQIDGNDGSTGTAMSAGDGDSRDLGPPRFYGVGHDALKAVDVRRAWMRSLAAPGREERGAHDIGRSVEGEDRREAGLPARVIRTRSQDDQGDPRVSQRRQGVVGEAVQVVGHEREIDLTGRKHADKLVGREAALDDDECTALA
jgi:hypothetical protein